MNKCIMAFGLQESEKIITFIAHQLKVNMCARRHQNQSLPRVSNSLAPALVLPNPTGSMRLWQGFGLNQNKLTQIAYTVYRKSEMHKKAQSCSKLVFLRGIHDLLVCFVE